MAYLNSKKLISGKRAKTFLLAGFALLFSVSCGKKGPLYMPKTTAETEQKTEQKAMPEKDKPEKDKPEKAKQPATTDTNNTETE